MADISNEIKNFREAVYGEEVRGSMISLAEKLNEVSEATEEAEKKRVTAENGRVSAETKRQTDTAEAIKKNNAATERANTAASAAETATEETNRATENANAKASLANTAAGKAETAAKSANDAAGSVEAAKNAALEAAELATAEAGKATTAASNANSKASAANTAAEKANTAADRAEKAAEHAEGLVLGDISEKTVTFEMASQRAGVESGDSLAIAFGKLAKYCADLKPHVFVDPVNNLLGTDPKLPLSATQGKALDEKIEGVKEDVTKLNGDIIDTSWKKSPYTFLCPLDSLMLIIAVDESIWLATSMTDMLALRKLNTKGAAYLFSQDNKNRTITVTHTSGSDVRLLIIQKNKK